MNGTDVPRPVFKTYPTSLYRGFGENNRLCNYRPADSDLHSYTRHLECKQSRDTAIYVT